jgi:hypothetical protein
MLRGAGAAWLGLIVLQAATTKNGSGAIGGLLNTVNGLVKRALDPSVAAIPDHSKDAGAVKDSDGNVHPKIPDYLGGGVVPGPGKLPPGTKQNPNFHIEDPPPTDQHNPAYDNPHPNTPGGIPMSYQYAIPGITNV